MEREREGGGEGGLTSRNLTGFFVRPIIRVVSNSARSLPPGLETNDGEPALTAAPPLSCSG